MLFRSKCNNGYTKSGNSCKKDIVIPANAHASGTGWACDAGYTKTAGSCVNTAEMKAAQIYINDLLEYIKLYPNTFDILNISSLMVVNKNVLDGRWSDKEQDAFKLLQKYARTSKEFLSFVDEQNVLREKQALIRLTATENEIKKYISYFTAYLQNNITTELAPGLLQNINFAEEELTSKDIARLNSTLEKLHSYLVQVKLLPDYKQFAQSSSAEQSLTQPKGGVTSSVESVPQVAIIGDEATRATMYDEAQREAQDYINDLVAFLKNNSAVYDITEIVGLVSANKAILTGEWNQVLEKNFAKLKNFTSSSQEFLDYHESRNDERQKVMLNEIALQNQKLKNINAYLRFYIQNNITSSIAQTVIDKIKFGEASLAEQNLGALTKANNQLEGFIAKNNLNKDYLQFVKSLSATDKEAASVTASKIDAIELVNFDFIKKAGKFDFIALVNLSGRAPNALLNLEGDVVFEKDEAIACFYQSQVIKNDLKYYLYDKVSNREYLVRDKGFECNQNNLLKHDLVFFEKDALLREDKSYLASLTAAIASNHLQLYGTVAKEEQKKDFTLREMKSANIKEGVSNETVIGFGSLIIDNDNTTLCTDVENTLAHKSIMNLLSNEFTRMGYGKSVGRVSFNNVADTFVNVQRGRCGFIYAGEKSLANLLNAFEKSRTKYDLLPIWYSNKQIDLEQQRQASKQQQTLMDVQKTKEELEKQKLLEQERLKADGILKAEEQKRLRNLHRNVVEAHIQVVEKEAKLLFDKYPNNDGPMLTSYPQLVSLMETKLKEKWELDEFNVEINDYGLSTYRGRTIATFISEINFTLKNRMLGDYEDFCYRLAILDDKEFDVLREPELASCKANSLDYYKKRLDFQSSWVVQ